MIVLNSIKVQCVYQKYFPKSQVSLVGVSRGLQLRDRVPLGLDGPNTNLMGVDSFNSADGKSGQLWKGTKKPKKLKLKPAGPRISWD